MSYKVGDIVIIKDSLYSAPNGAAVIISEHFADSQFFRVLYVHFHEFPYNEGYATHQWNVADLDIKGYAISHLNRLKVKKALGL